MSLMVIGAGFGRTGTLSMKSALEQLGCGPCHHMLEVIATDEQREVWRGIAHGEIPDWERAFKGFNATVDWPGAHYWRELADYFPEAKILLTVRSAESWWKSVSATIFPAIVGLEDRGSVGAQLIQEQVFGGVLDDRDRAIAIYERHNETVQAAFDAERLLTYSVGDGWAPLCEFLDKPIPQEAFPQSNSTEEFNARIADMTRRTS